MSGLGSRFGVAVESVIELRSSDIFRGSSFAGIVSATAFGNLFAFFVGVWQTNYHRLSFRLIHYSILLLANVFGHIVQTDEISCVH